MAQQYVNNGPRVSPGTFVTLQDLIDLRKDAWQHMKVSIKKNSFLSGQKETSIRGRGIEFDATREYQSGDDIRSMAWRVTARSMKPHIKVYREEKERPIWLAMDLSPSMYFGTRTCFKSVRSILDATSTGWSFLLKRERTGIAMIGPAQKSSVFQPSNCEKSYLTMLNSLALTSRLQPAFNGEQYLMSLLLLLQQHVRFGSLIYLYSDFLQFDTEVEKLISYFKERAQIIINFVYDPFEETPPPPYHYMVTNGQQKLHFNMRDALGRENYRQLFQVKFEKIKRFASKHNIILRMCSTGFNREKSE
jgi:uncharacterized protein (DUF58 family)